MKLEMLTSGSSPSQKTRVSVKRWCSTCIYYWNPYSNRQTWKNLVFFHRDQCDLVTGIKWKHFQWPGNVVWCISDEKYFHHFSNSYFELYFLHDFIKKSNTFHAFSSKVDNYVRLHQTKPMKSIGFFDEIMQKI